MTAAQPGGGATKAPTRYCDHLYDIECHALNEDRSIRLERNDPDIEGLWIFSDYWSSRVGQAIGTSQCLRKICFVVGWGSSFASELFHGLSRNRSIEVMHIYSAVDERGRRLDVIDLLAPFLELNSNLRIFEIDGTLSHNMNSLSSLLENRTSNIEHLGLMGSKLVDDDIRVLCDVLVKKNRLQSLKLSELRAPSLHALLSTLSHSACQLEELGLWSCSCADDEDAFLNVQTFGVNNSLLRLDLSWNHFATQAWISFFILLRDTFVGLEALVLDGCTILDEGISELIATLANNARLREVHGGMCFGKTIWDYCSRTLFNKTCIDSTFSSNHTLHIHDIDTNSPSEDDDSVVDDALKDDVMWSLKMNENEYKAEVSQIKIIQAHFSGPNLDVSILTRMPEPVLPFAFEWIGRTRVGLSLMYLVVRELPTLFDEE